MTWFDRVLVAGLLIACGFVCADLGRELSGLRTRVSLLEEAMFTRPRHVPSGGNRESWQIVPSAHDCRFDLPGNQECAGEDCSCWSPALQASRDCWVAVEGGWQPWDRHSDPGVTIRCRY